MPCLVCLTKIYYFKCASLEEMACLFWLNYCQNCQYISPDGNYFVWKELPKCLEYCRIFASGEKSFFCEKSRALTFPNSFCQTHENSRFPLFRLFLAFLIFLYCQRFFALSKISCIVKDFLQNVHWQQFLLANLSRVFGHLR